MKRFLPIITFIAGCGLGGFAVWNLFRTKEIQSAPRQGEHCSLADVVSPQPASELPAPPQGRPPKSDVAEFRWARVFYGGARFNRKPLLVTCHTSDSWGHLVRFYAKEGERFRLLHEEGFGWGYLADPLFFQRSKRDFMLLCNNSGGSASQWDYRCVYLGSPYSRDSIQPEVRALPIEAPVTTLKHLFKKGQHSPPTRTYIKPGVASGLAFSFHIWNPGEHNNFPTGGSVTGSLKLVLDENGKPLRFALDSWERNPPTK